MKKSQFSQFLVFIAITLIVLGAGFYIGVTYGPNALRTEAQRKAEIVAIEKDLSSGLNTGHFSTVTGRIKLVNAQAGTFVFLDQTLGVITKAPGGVVERTIVTDNHTILAKEETAGGPHFPIRISELRPGQSVAIYLVKSDLSEDNAAAKEVVVYEYIPAQQN